MYYTISLGTMLQSTSKSMLRCHWRQVSEDYAAMQPVVGVETAYASCSVVIHRCETNEQKKEEWTKMC